ncbi:MAG TPA: hypothetical protein VMF91_03805 [Bryobacteraceae bacterium]|nr:hypothetical protein [Bryobacteraceae bacterium]
MQTNKTGELPRIQRALTGLRIEDKMRGVLLALAFIAAPLFTIAPRVAKAAGSTDFSGNWRLDPSKSPEENGAMVTLAIQNESGKMNYQRTVRERNGREIVARFTCPVDGSQCDLDENGHKAKVSLWYDGSALMMLKTGGPREDETTERRLQLSPDGKTLTVHFTNLAGNDKPETLVFTKEATSSAPGQ